MFLELLQKNWVFQILICLPQDWIHNCHFVLFIINNVLRVGRIIRLSIKIWSKSVYQLCVGHIGAITKHIDWSLLTYINNMGGIRSKVCNELATNIWLWCIQRGIWLSASYIYTSQNVADIESRKFNENIEWKLTSNVFRSLH
jgi:hypothetical protein